jgi:transcriptional regulator with XRE-family HTH domain
MTTDLTLKQQKKAFAKKFKAARTAAGMSQVKLAKLTGISNSTLSNYEVAKTLPDEANMKKLAKVLPALSTPAPKAGAKVAGVASLKPSLIEEAIVHPESAKAAFMRTLVEAAPEMKSAMNTIMERAKKANISQPEAMSMLGVLLEQ